MFKYTFYKSHVLYANIKIYTEMLTLKYSYLYTCICTYALFYSTKCNHVE